MMNNIWQTIFHSDITKPADYSLENLALIFFIFAFSGFIWKVIYTTITEKIVAKRGMLKGSWLPLYGVGGVLILFLFGSFRANPPLVFVLAMALCGTFEYFTGVIVEHFYGQRWWDYSEKRLNFRGCVCLSGIILFGVSGTAAVCTFGTMLNDNIRHLWFPIHTALVAVLGLVFVADILTSVRSPNSGKGITYDIEGQHKDDNNDKKSAE